MIIPEDTPKAPIPPESMPGPTGLPGPSQYTPLLDEGPPAYSGPSSPTQYFHPGQPRSPNSPEHPVYRYGQSPSTRFLRALCVAWIIWILLTIFVNTFIWLVNWRHRPGWDVGNGRWEYDIPSGIALSGCVQGSEWTNDLQIVNSNLSSTWSRHRYDLSSSSKATFTLPLTDNTLQLLARGHLTAGIVNITSSPTQPQDTTTIHIRVRYVKETARNVVKVCKIAYDVKSAPSGLGIFTPKWHNGPSSSEEREYATTFETVVILPESTHKQTPFLVKGLYMDFPMMTQRFEYRKNKVHFGHVVLRGSSASIEAKSLTAQTATITTANGSIRGTFNATTSLVMSTTNGEVDVNVGLDHSNEGVDPAFHASTTNGPLEATISLTKNDTASLSNSTYKISATTTNSNLHLQFASQPINSKLHLTTTTSNGPAEVRLHPSYEGVFVLQSPSVNIIQDGSRPQDPSGAGRERNVRWETRKLDSVQVVEGSVKWGEEKDRKPGDLGHVQVRNSNARLTFAL